MLTNYEQGGNREDLSDVVSKILKDKTNTLNAIGISGKATNTRKHEWMEAGLKSFESALSSALASGDNHFHVADATEGAKFVAGTLCQVAGSEEVMLVSSVSTATVSVDRGYGSTDTQTAETAIGTNIEIIGTAELEGADARFESENIRTRVYNICEVLSDDIKVSGTQEAVDKAGVDSEVAYQAEVILKEKLRELNRTVIRGIIAEPTDNTTRRTMKGLVEFIGAATGNTTNQSGSALSEAVLVTSLEAIFQDGGQVDTIVCNSFNKRKIDAFNSSYTETPRTDRTAGTYVDRFESSFGSQRVVVDYDCPQDKVLLLDSSRCQVVPLNKRAFGIEDLAKTGDNIKKQLVGEYTLECKNALKAHGYIYNTSTS